MNLVQLIEDWNGMPFLIVWGLLVMGLGYLYAFKSTSMESWVRGHTNRVMRVVRFPESRAPDGWVVRFYRVGGYLFLVLGIVAFTVGLVGTIGFATGMLK